MATTKLSDFTLKKKLGEGSYSQVSLAIRRQDGLEYALKQVNTARLNDKERENALNEVRFLASIRHPNITGYRAAFIDETSQSLCIIMEYANDGDLLGKVGDLRKSGKHMPEKDIWRIFIQLAQGLQCLHSMNIMHRDLKPANVFLWQNNQSVNQDEITAKIGDMNVSKLARIDGLNYTQTGTPYYASPEVWRDQPYDFKSDVWSLGCILYEMTALRPPFQAQDMDQLFKKVLRGSYQKIPGVYSQDLAQLIRTMLTVDPSMRPTIGQVLSMTSIKNHMESAIDQTKIDSSCTLLQTIKDTKDIKVLKRMLPKSNFEVPSKINGESIIINKDLATQRKIEKKLRENSANSKSSITLLARNQSLKSLNKESSTRRQLQILPLLTKSKEQHEKLLQRIRDSSQLLNKRKLSNKPGGVQQDSRNSKINISYNSITQEEVVLTLPEGNLTAGHHSLSNRKILGQSQKQRTIMERARSEQRLINLNNTPQNLLPQLGVVSEAPSTKRMNLKQINKNIQKQMPNNQISASHRMKLDQSLNSSPMRQYGAIVNNLGRSEHTSLSNSLLQRSNSKSKIVPRQVPYQKYPSTQRQSQGIIEPISQVMKQNRYASNIHLEQTSGKRNTGDITRSSIVCNDEEIVLQLPMNNRHLSPINRSFQNNRTSVGRGALKSYANQRSNNNYLSSVNSNDDSSTPSEKGHKSVLKSLRNQQDESVFLKHPYRVHRDTSNQSLLIERGDNPFESNNISTHNNSVIMPTSRPKIKPVKVIPSSRKKQHQQIMQAQNPYKISNQYPQTSQTTLKASNSQLSLHQIQVNSSSVNTTVTHKGGQHYNNTQVLKEEEDEQKRSLSNMTRQLIMQPSMSKPSLLPLRQQLYMDERNPFLDQQTILRHDHVGAHSLLNNSEIIEDHQSLYQITTNLNPLNDHNTHQEVMMRHRRNNSSLDYGYPQSVRSLQNANTVLPPVNRSSSNNRYSETPSQLLNNVPLKLPSAFNNQHQILSLSHLQNLTPGGVGMHALYQQQYSGKSASSELIASSKKRKSRINLLEKARMILIDQQKKFGENSSFEMTQQANM